LRSASAASLRARTASVAFSNGRQQLQGDAEPAPGLFPRMSSFSAALHQQCVAAWRQRQRGVAFDDVNNLTVITLEQDVRYGFSEFAPA
jgi:hypothetical protein